MKKIKDKKNKKTFNAYIKLMDHGIMEYGPFLLSLWNLTAPVLITFIILKSVARTFFKNSPFIFDRRNSHAGLEQNYGK